MAKTTNVRLKDLTNRLKSIKAKDIMTKEVITTTEDTPLAEIAELMIKNRVSGLPVLKRGKIVGVITDTDLFIVMDMIKFGAVVENHLRVVSNPTVKFAMSTQVHKIKDTASLEEVITTMKYKNVYTLPVVKKNKMVGVIGRRDVFKNFYAAVKDLI